MKSIVDSLSQRKRVFAVIIIAGLAHSSGAAVVSDLASPSQAVRDAAAKTLRQAWEPPSSTNWDSLLAKLKLDTPETNAMEILAAYTNNVEGSTGNGPTEWHRYRLDDLWLLECAFRSTSSNRVLIHRALMKRMREVPVDPPAGFSGAWTTYYVNGQPRGRGYYKDGHLEGEGVGFYPDGSKATIHQWVSGISEGEEIGYFSSGKVKYRGQYHTNSPVGVWTWFREDGEVELRRDYSKP